MSLIEHLSKVRDFRRQPRYPSSAGSPLNSWSTGFTSGNQGYTISLTGAQFVSNTTSVPFEFDSNFGLLLVGITYSSWQYLRKRIFSWKN